MAVLDSRLATAGYRGTLLARVPPMNSPRSRVSSAPSPPNPDPSGGKAGGRRGRGSEAEPVEGILAVLPALLHPDEELEIGTPCRVPDRALPPLL